MLWILQQLFNQAGVPNTRKPFLEDLEEWCKHADVTIRYFSMIGET